MMNLLRDQQMGLRPHFDFWQTTRFQLHLDRPLVMGIVNVTPDSFSDVNNSPSPSQAIELAQQHLRDGADMLDVGGESTRPGAKPLSAEQEWERIQPVLSEVMKWDKPVSVDTYHPDNMRKALDMGVDVINDIWALRMGNALQVVSQYNCGVCLMHMHGEPATMQVSPMEGDVLKPITLFFQSRLHQVQQAGIDLSRIVLDPGVGFGKTVNQNFSLLRHQDVFMQMGLPLLVGWSRKSALGIATGLTAHDRLVPSVVAAMMAIERGAGIVRVHDVSATVAGLKTWMAVEKSHASTQLIKESM